MIDLARRNTLKALAATGVGATVGSATLAGIHVAQPSQADHLPELARIDITTRMSVVRNDLEVVLTNSGAEPVTITALTPRKVVVPRGEFDLAGLLGDGPLQLPVGASAVVPIRPHRGALTPSARGHSLTDALRKSVSVVTDYQAFASVTVREITALA